MSTKKNRAPDNRKEITWKMERCRLSFVLVATLLTIFSSFVSEVEGSGDSINGKKQCDIQVVIGSCGDNERCMLDPLVSGTYVCVCKINYMMHPTTGTCIQEPTTTVPPEPETTTEKLNKTSGSSGSSVAVGLLIPTLVIFFGVLGFCAARRYGLLPCRRNLYGNVLVTRDDDDDDPPIASIWLVEQPEK